MIPNDRYWRVKKITLIGIVINLVLGFSKLFGGFFFRSHALIADGVHSFSDLLTDIMVLFASKYGSQSADANHPYGHQRIETLTTFFMSVFLILAGLGIGWDAISSLIHADYEKPEWPTLPIILLSILGKEILFHYTLRVGKQLQSDLVITNAWHHRSDAASSLVVLLGLIGSFLGFIYLDAIAAVLVTLMIIKMGWDYGWQSIKELIDTAVEPELLKQMEELIKTVDGVRKIHQLRSRLMAGDIFIDVHILVSPRFSVSEGHYIAQHVRQILMQEIPRIKDVTVHVDPEEDEICYPSNGLPGRAQLEQAFMIKLAAIYPQLLFWNLHYQNRKLVIDMVFSPEFAQWLSIVKDTKEILQQHPELSQFRFMSLVKRCKQDTKTENQFATPQQMDNENKG